MTRTKLAPFTGRWHSRMKWCDFVYNNPSKLAQPKTVHQGDYAITEAMNKITSTDTFAPLFVIVTDDVVLMSSLQ